jgi:predicted nucleic acid-binding protein
MTSASALPPLHGRVLVWDTSPLFHAIKARKIEILGITAQTWQGVPRRNVTTQTVLDELSRNGLPLGDLGWLEVVHVDHLDELKSLVEWLGVLSGQESNHGEATVLAWADVHGAVAVIDDAAARRAGRQAGLPIWGSLRVVAEAVKDGSATEYAATTLVDTMMATGMRYPFQAGQFIGWAKQNGML